MSNANEKRVEDAISGHKIAVFSKSYCPYCAKTKSTISDLGLSDEDVEIIELDEVDGGASMQNYLEKKTGQRTVPNVFIKGKHIGGNSDVQALGQGKLKSMVA